MRATLTIIFIYVPPGVPFNTPMLDSVVETTPGLHIIQGDVSVHHSLWGGQTTDVPGRLILELH